MGGVFMVGVLCLCDVSGGGTEEKQEGKPCWPLRGGFESQVSHRRGVSLGQCLLDSASLLLCPLASDASLTSWGEE